MITAKEARAKVVGLETKDGISEREMIEQRINEEIEKGKMVCHFDKCLSASAILWLESLGYRLNWEMSHIGGFTNVYW